MKKIKLPSSFTVIIASLGSFWLATMINPSFNPIGIMMLLFVPILIIDTLYPQPELKQLLAKIQTASKEEPEPEAPLAAGDLIDENAETA